MASLGMWKQKQANQKLDDATLGYEMGLVCTTAALEPQKTKHSVCWLTVYLRVYHGRGLQKCEAGSRICDA